MNLFIVLYNLVVFSQHPALLQYLLCYLSLPTENQSRCLKVEFVIKNFHHIDSCLLITFQLPLLGFALFSAHIGYDPQVNSLISKHPAEPLCPGPGHQSVAQLDEIDVCVCIFVDDFLIILMFLINPDNDPISKVMEGGDFLKLALINLLIGVFKLVMIDLRTSR